MTTIGTSFRKNGGAQGAFAAGLLGAGLVAVGAVISFRTPAPSVLSLVALVGFVGISGWMLISRNYPLTLSVLLVYLLLLDGFLKLKTGSQFTTLGRDVLFYSIVAGAVARFVIERKAIELPPLSGWIIAFAALVLVSMFNPGSYPALHAVASVRPHLEFVPMFFFGYLIMRDAKRLRVFLALLLACGAVNGVVNMIQYNLTPDQLSAWGPGYR